MFFLRDQNPVLFFMGVEKSIYREKNAHAHAEIGMTHRKLGSIN